MKNIRCHANVEIKLNERVNFITGSNGSGKSSILTAIRLALGMKVDKSSARSVSTLGGAGNRAGKKSTAVGTASAGVSIGSILRADSDGEAIAEIDLRNVGHGALDDAQWGTTIMLRRTLTQHGTRCSDTLEAFRNCNLSDKVVKLDASRAPVPQTAAQYSAWLISELQGAFNAHFNNPIMIMDQETSKRFFTSSASKQYSFVLEACGLQRAFDEVAATTVHLRNARKRLDDVRLEVQRLKDDAAAKDKIASAVRGLNAQVEQVNLLKNDVEWARLYDEKRAGAALHAKADRAAANQRQYEVLGDQTWADEIKKNEAAVKKTQEEVAARVAAVEAAVRALDDKSAEVTAKRTALVRVRAAADAAERRAKAAGERVARARRALAAWEETLVTSSAETQRAAWQRDVASKKQAMERSKGRAVDAEAELAAKIAARDEAKKRHSEAKQEQLIADAACEALDGELRAIKRREESRLEAIEERRAAAARPAAAASSAAAIADAAEAEKLAGLRKNAAGNNFNLLCRAAFVAEEQIAKAVRQGRFRVPPIAPLLRHITVRREWSHALDANFFNALLGTVVDSAADAATLKDVVSDTRIANAYTSFAKLNHSAPGAPPLSRISDAVDGVPDAWRGRRLIDAVTIDDDWAYNLAIDVLHFNRVLLADSDVEAARIAEMPGRKPVFILTREGAKYTPRMNGGYVRVPHGYSALPAPLTRLAAPPVPVAGSAAAAAAAAAALLPPAEQRAAADAADLEAIAAERAAAAEITPRLTSARAASVSAAARVKREQALEATAESRLGAAREAAKNAKAAAAAAEAAFMAAVDNEPEADDEQAGAAERAEHENKIAEEEGAAVAALAAAAAARKTAEDEEKTVLALEAELERMGAGGADDPETKELVAKATAAEADLASSNKLYDAFKAKRDEVAAKANKLRDEVAAADAALAAKCEAHAKISNTKGPSHPDGESLTAAKAEAQLKQLEKTYKEDAMRYGLDAGSAALYLNAHAAAKTLYDEKRLELQNVQKNVDELTVLRNGQKSSFITQKRRKLAQIAKDFAAKMKAKGSEAALDITHSENLRRSSGDDREKPRHDEGELKVSVRRPCS